jgi:nucleoside-diphosphate kinase
MSITPSIQQTLCIIKPHVLKGKTEQEIKDISQEFGSIFQKNGLTIIAEELFKFDEETAKEFYRDHKGKDFFEKDLIPNMTANECYAFILQGENAIQNSRKLIGATDPAKAAEGTLRGDFKEAKSKSYNVVHGSDSPESAKREIVLIFPKLSNSL